VPHGLEEAIARCLRIEREERFQSAPELAAALAPFAGPGGSARAATIARIVAERRGIDSATPVVIVADTPARGELERTLLSAESGEVAAVAASTGQESGSPDASAHSPGGAERSSQIPSAHASLTPREGSPAQRELPLNRGDAEHSSQVPFGDERAAGGGPGVKAAALKKIARRPFTFAALASFVTIGAFALLHRASPPTATSTATAPLPSIAPSMPALDPAPSTPPAPPPVTSAPPHPAGAHASASPPPAAPRPHPRARPHRTQSDEDVILKLPH